MDNGSINIHLKGFEIFESVPTNFGTGAHILIPKAHSDKKIKIIVGKPVKVLKNKIQIDFFGNEILERKPGKFGTGFHIIIPRKYIGKRIKLVFKREDE